MLAGRCRYHADRDAVAICMRCRAAICAACTTRLDGVNHCRTCLDELRAAKPAAERRDHGPLARASLVLLVHGGVLLLVMLVALFWRSRV